MKRMTLRDVAREARVSVSTVSSVINESRFVSEDKKKRVLEVIEKVSYQPNLIARSLKIRNSKTIGMIFPDIENAFFISLIKEAEEFAFKSGYNVILCNTQNDPETEKKHIKLLKGKMVDGFLVITSFKDKEYLESELAGEEVVFADRFLGIKHEVVVKLDNVMGTKMAVEYLTELGHKDSGYINIKPEINIGSERLEGYIKGLKDAGIPYNPDFVKFSGFSVESSYEKMLELLEQDNKPTAVISISNRITIGAIRAIKDKGLKIPEEISIIGFDEINIADLLDPPLTVIAQPAYEIGRMSTEILINKIKGKNRKKGIINLEPELIVRGSCRKI